tara:strand:- start:1738 stop:2007 length:270 start_codon:yes stop_codon:yes gene_type:complete
MFRLWGKIIKGNNIKSDHVFELDTKGLTLDDKIDQGLESLCNHFDIQKPMWFNDNYKDIGLIGKTRFIDHHFIETINFDYLEIEIIEKK